MEITDVRATRLRFDGPAWMDALDVIGARRVVLDEVETDGGLVGLGEADALGAGHLVVRRGTARRVRQELEWSVREVDDPR